jgi:hypothetical protein
MTSSKIAHRNHFVSRLYLKGWTDPQDRLWIYRILVGHPNVPLWKQSSRKGVAYHEHLYTRVLTTGESDEVEKWFAKEFEEPAVDPLRKAILGDRLSPEDWKCLIRFLAAQDVRTPARMLEILARWGRDLPEMTVASLADSVETMTKAHKEGRPIRHESAPNADRFPSRVTVEKIPGADHGLLRLEVVVGRSLWLFQLDPLLTSTVKALQRHKWTFLRPPKNMTWLTSDDPVMKVNHPQPGRYDFKGGWGSLGTEIFFPLGPQHLLYTRIGDKQVPLKGTRVSDGGARAIQRMTIEHAHRHIFSAAVDDDVSLARPRHVDAAAVKSESEQWRRWHEEQSAAEREIHTNSKTAR